jgi:hypothetical protein
MSAIKLSTPSSGSISLSPADTASNLTITVPAVTGTMLTNKTAGTVLQVVQAVKTDTFTTSSTSFTDITGISVSITPSSASSKILVIPTINSSATSSGWNMFFRMMRNSTPIFIGDTAGSRTLSSFQHYLANNQDIRCLTASFLDSPNTTSSVTYKVQTASQSSGVSVVVNMTGADGDSASQGRTASSITVLEIAA